ncbi:hypothetical protein L3X38_024371 [Prunus dulcis]|uniref:Transposable element protein n=1 Tax=Prunus dulcis TaxID=3755 RepID=A0AAD4Z6Z4_PRUDU|nr:hypothetical protein L3X38_024371 [Prunus dulcis]
MPGIDPQIICHRLHVNLAIKPVAQKRRNFAPKQVAIIEAEIDKLLAAAFIQEVSYAEWLANVVLVAKKDKGLWRVCVDYTDLNKATTLGAVVPLQQEQGQTSEALAPGYSRTNEEHSHPDSSGQRMKLAPNFYRVSINPAPSNVIRRNRS